MKITLISGSKQALESIESRLGGSAQLQSHAATAAELMTIVTAAQPDVLLLDGLGYTEADLAYVEEITRDFPTLAVLLLSDDQAPTFLMRAMRAGVREVLPVRVEVREFEAALERIAKRRENLGGRQAGKVIAFLSSKGGSGATFLAVNFAHAIACQGTQKVALLDLNLQFGDASLFVLEGKPLRTLMDVVKDIDRLDGVLLNSCMSEISPGFSLLAAPENPEDGLGIKSTQVDQLLAMAVRHFDYVVVDVGRAFNSIMVSVLDRSEEIYLVLQMSLPFIRDARRMLNVLRSIGHVAPKVTLALNRFEKDEELDIHSIEKALGAKIDWTVPNSFKNVTLSVNRGIPILTMAPKDPVSKRLREMVTHLVPQDLRKSGGWLGNLFGRG